jgi:hypothetical protein
MLYHQVHLPWAGFELTILVVIGTDCTGSYKLPYDHDHDDPIHPDMSGIGNGGQACG